MTSLISGLLAYLLLYKYITLFIVCYLAALLIPLPSNTSLLAASAFASQGYLNFYIVIAVALAANVLGDITGFLLARRFGKEFLMKVGFKKIILSKRYADTELFIVRHSKITIFMTRFIGGIGPLVNILTGFSEEITIKKFLTYGILGETVYVMTLSLGGYFIGNAWGDVTGSIELFSIIVICMVCIFYFKSFFIKTFKRLFQH